MMTLSLAGTTLITGDVVATLLIDFAAALANANRAAAVEVRAYTLDGRLTRALLMLDGHSPLLAVGCELPLPEPDNSRAVRDMSEALMGMLEGASSASNGGGIRSYFDDLDL